MRSRRQSCNSSGGGQHHTIFLLCILLFLASSMPIAASSTNLLNNSSNNKQRHLPEADCICPENGKCKAKGDEECCEDKDIWKFCKIECVCPKDCDEKKEFCCDWNDKKCQTSSPTFSPTTESPTISSPPTLSPVTSPPTPSPVRDFTPDTVDSEGGVLPDVVDTPSPAGMMVPTESPTFSPTDEPTYSPTSSPSESVHPTAFPSDSPTLSTMPTVSPSSTPSSSPSVHPTTTPSTSPTDSAMPSMAPIPYTRSTRVDIRYKPWTELSSDDQVYAEQLGYTMVTWDELGSNSIENLDWQRLTREQKTAAGQLGYDKDSWDCWQNHFQSYRWIDLNLPYIQVGQWWSILGWDIYSWNAYQDAPKSDSLTWYELSDEERYSAAQLCYTRLTWDETNNLYDGYPIAISEVRYQHWMELDRNKRQMLDTNLKYSPLSWNVLGLEKIESKGWNDLTVYEKEAAKFVGFAELDWDCWQNHFRSFSWDELELYGLDMPFMVMGWSELSWDGVEAKPSSEGMTWKELSQAEREAASEVCYFKDNWDGIDMTPNNGPFAMPKVKQRYVEWDNLSSDMKRIASDSLRYDESKWNNLGTAKIESQSWEQLTEHQKSDAIALGFYQRTWDCFHNHYRSYEWGDLERDTRDALQVLGWNEISWNNDEEPQSYDNEWSRLSENEQSVALVLCFFEDNWDGKSLEEVGVVIKEDGTIIEADGTIIPPEYTDVDGSEGNSGGGGSGGGGGLAFGGGSSSGSENDPNAPASGSGSGAASNSDGLNSNERSSSASIFGARRIILVLSVVSGALAQSLM